MKKYFVAQFDFNKRAWVKASMYFSSKEMARAELNSMLSKNPHGHYGIDSAEVSDPKARQYYSSVGKNAGYKWGKIHDAIRDYYDSRQWE